MPSALRPSPSALSPPQKKRTALFLSRINPKKGLPMLLDAWKKVAPEDWELVIAGNDDSNHLPTIEKKIAELGLQKQVTLAGPLFDEAKDQAFQQADLFILPSYSENFGIVVAEALSHQVPVLTTTGCPWEELETQQCGWWVEPIPEGIANGLSEALQKATEELSSMGVRGRQLVEQNYQWPAIAEKMHRFYKWILEGGQKPDFII
ncbi:MAG: glycosyltransferase [Opitutales bacterium]|nr:glycosyltransferase [Opitutales bacterium]